MYDELFFFSKVAKIGNFSKAAALFNTSQGTVSKSISRLEKQMNVKLFERNSRSLALTTAGKLLLDRIGTMDSEIESIISEVQQDSLKGQIRLAIPSSLSMTRVSPFIGQFLNKNPGIDLVVSFQNHKINMLAENFDIAILNHIPDQLTQKIRLIYSSKIILCCSPEYIQNYGQPMVEDSYEKTIITGKLNPDNSISSFTTAYNEKDNTPIKFKMPSRIIINDFYHSYMLAKSGAIIGAVLENEVVEDLKYGRLVRVFPEYYYGTWKYYLLKKSSITNHKINLFINFLEEQFGIQ